MVETVSGEPASQRTARAAISPRMAIGIVFLCFGGSLGLWGGSVAEVLRAGDISPAVLGSAFLGFSAAGVLGMAVAGRIRRSVSLKTRLLVLIAVTAICLAALFHVRSEVMLVAGLFVYSVLLASIDLVMNSEGVAVEHDRGFPVLAGFHGLASLGMGFGAIAGSYLSVTAGLSATAALSVAIYGLAILAVAIGTPDRGATHPTGLARRGGMPSPAIVVIGLIVGASMACELATIMFSAQTLADQAPEFAAFAGIGATAFALFQASIRLAGDRIRRRFGDAQIIGLSLGIALCGFIVVATSNDFVQGGVGFAIVGIGTACIVPCGFAIASRDTAISAAAAISTLAMIGAIVRVPAPLIYGELAARIGFAPGFALYAALAAAALALGFFALGRARLGRPA